MFVALIWLRAFFLAVILGAVYMLHMVQRVLFGEITRKENEDLKDMNVREVLVMAPKNYNQLVPAECWTVNGRDQTAEAPTAEPQVAK